MEAAELIISLAFFSLALIGAFFGILLSTKCEGKLKVIITLLVAMSSLFLIYEVGNLMQVYEIYPQITALVLGILHGGILVLMLSVLVSISQIVSSVKKRRR